MNIRIIILSVIIISTLMLLINCGDDVVNSNRDVVFPDSNVSYQNHVQLFLNIKCAYRGCHSAEDRSGDRSLADYFALFESSNAGLIIKGVPESSRIIRILEGNPPHGGVYDFPAGYFSENHVNGMKTWIKEGAKFN